MKTETLQALLLDRELGELSPEVAELLEAYLAEHPAALGESEAAVHTVNTMRETVRRFPHLVAVAEPPEGGRVVAVRSWRYPWLLRAAALIMATSVAAWLGYEGGRSGTTPGNVAAGQKQGGQFDGLWTQYQVAYDANRRPFVTSYTR